MSEDRMQKCNHCKEWINTESDRYVSGYIGLVNSQKVYLHNDWCSDVYEATHALSDRTVRNRIGRDANA